jgi:hypothetical protein
MIFPRRPDKAFPLIKRPARSISDEGQANIKSREPKLNQTLTTILSGLYLAPSAPIKEGPTPTHPQPQAPKRTRRGFRIPPEEVKASVIFQALGQRRLVIALNDALDGEQNDLPRETGALVRGQLGSLVKSPHGVVAFADRRGSAAGNRKPIIGRRESPRRSVEIIPIRETAVSRLKSAVFGNFDPPRTRDKVLNLNLNCLGIGGRAAGNSRTALIYDADRRIVDDRPRVESRPLVIRRKVASRQRSEP